MINWAAKTGRGCEGMAKAIMNRSAHPQQGFRPVLGIMSLAKTYADERLGLMVEREDRRLTTRLKKAKLWAWAYMEDIDFRNKRGLDKSLVMSLAGCGWIKGCQNLIIKPVPPE